MNIHSDNGCECACDRAGERVRERVRIEAVERLSDGFNRLTRTTLHWQRRDGRWQRLVREAADHGDGAAILLVEPRRHTVILVRQFRWAAFEGGHDGLMIEAIAGLLDGAAPEDCIRTEAEQEAGYRVRAPRKVFDCFMSPGSLTERVHGFVAEYDAADRIGPGGGLAAEGEDIEVLEVPLAQALGWVADGTIRDAKTVMLLQQIALQQSRSAANAKLGASTA